jgi:hypothetical protein
LFCASTFKWTCYSRRPGGGMAQSETVKYQEMVSNLKKYGVNHGYAALGTAVVIIGPGAPFKVYPTTYPASDLDKAASAGFLERRRLSGSVTLDTYAAKQSDEDY